MRVFRYSTVNRVHQKIIPGEKCTISAIVADLVTEFSFYREGLGAYMQQIVLQYLVFTARRYAKRGICRRCVSVCVCVSVTLRYCIKKAKHRITQSTQHDSPMTLVF